MKARDVTAVIAERPPTLFLRDLLDVRLYAEREIRRLKPHFKFWVSVAPAEPLRRRDPRAKVPPDDDITLGITPLTPGPTPRAAWAITISYSDWNARRRRTLVELLARVEASLAERR